MNLLVSYQPHDKYLQARSGWLGGGELTGWRGLLKKASSEQHSRTARNSKRGLFDSSEAYLLGRITGSLRHEAAGQVSRPWMPDTDRLSGFRALLPPTLYR
jgi:hypothetical protein